MLDPFTALSVAATVVQFVDCTTKLLSAANEIRKDGTSVDAEHLKRASSDLAALSKGLRNRPEGNTAVSAEETAVDAIALDCAIAADKLVDTLNALADGSERGKFWKSIRAALKTAWRKDEIETLTERLADYRQQLVVRLLALLNAKADLHFTDSSDRLRGLEKSSQRIVEVVTFTQGLLESALSSGNREQVVSAVLTLDDGTIHPLAGQPSTYTGAKGLPRQRNIQRVVTFRDDSGSDRPDHASVSTEAFGPLASRVLHSLHYRMVHVRRETVAESANGTFSWILEEQADQQPWDSFSEWLQQDADCYWMTGKAGSGKSTLMKHILSDERTMEYLQVWAGSKPLATASFFFWAQGVSLQKTQEGLLRGLLHDLLEQSPSLIPDVFPDICLEMTKQKPERGSIVPTLEELRISFKKLVHAAEGRLKVCLFIDGMDEYEGDRRVLCDFLLGVARSSADFKIAVSSRPWNVFVDMFARQPNLHLQDLTRSDIRLFASESLKKCHGVEELEEVSPGTTDELIESICEKAAGVFLWVVLAVRTVRESILNGDNVAVLKEKVDELPEDLEAMYKKMFKSLSQEAQVDAARMILIVLRGTSITDSPVSLLQMALSEVTLDDAIQAPLKVMPASQRQSRCQRTKRRLQAQTHGLLEVVGRDEQDPVWSSSARVYVTFFHRTVADFFKTSDMWDLITRLQSDRDFATEIRLLASCLCEIKSLPFQRALITKSDRLFENALQILACARYFEVQTRRPHKLVLDELEKVLKTHWEEATSFKVHHYGTVWGRTRDSVGEWANITTHGLIVDSLDAFKSRYPFLCLATDEGCALYVVDKASELDDLKEKDKAYLLLGMSLRFQSLAFAETHLSDEEDLLSNYATAVGTLFGQGADPNYVVEQVGYFEETSPWTDLVQKVLGRVPSLYPTPRVDMTRLPKLVELFRLFILAGADMNVKAETIDGDMSLKEVWRKCEAAAKRSAQTRDEEAEVEAGCRPLWELIEERGTGEPRSGTITSKRERLKRRFRDLQARWVRPPSTRADGGRTGEGAP